MNEEKEIKINPQFVRIYPTIVIKNTELENLYKNGDFTPLTLEESIQITVKMLRLFNYHKIKVIKIGLHSEISKNDIVAGPFHQSFGEIVKGELLLDSIIADFYKNQLIKTSSKNLSLVLGHNQRLLNKVKNIIKKDKIKILIDNVIKEF